ncbi:UDP-N-acetylmuramoyl-L-alanyl-D-glutamate--2,6-diaminopimelate ligase [Frankliniella fusca]|uniref:UDP-N-acetylmuramoyl-L-alanyl-D-glutamate--2, 6-diaminopimelate ligase n=1 Tax=Frankliniella fusca TaxID=407009 RepID=A0AAE1H2C3_9NEOP|nr:UDP-N-acetylmuramoyl-L-alanyl-D-glutamate--2,6-diaminopimelate ligase [Frankliniella fusca]
MSKVGQGILCFRRQFVEVSCSNPTKIPDRCCVFGCQSGYDSDRAKRKAKNLPQLSQFRPKVSRLSGNGNSQSG